VTEQTIAAAARFRWHPHRQFLRNRIPCDVRAWLLDPDSLTKRLQQNCGNDFHVRVFAQSWHKPALDEALALGIRYDRWAWLREVHLYCADTPLVFARTVIPRRTLTGHERRLASLGAQPLGAALFADPDMTRNVVELARIPRGSELFDIAVHVLARKPREIWGRRSVFYLGKKPLLVSEIFLPPIKTLAAPSAIQPCTPS
jgi:chorismate--pyruvate lyase